MAQVQQLYVIALATVIGVVSVADTKKAAPQLQIPRYLQKKFFPDDPLLVAPKPLDVKDPSKIKLNDLYDLFLYTLKNPAEKHPETGPPIRAMATNTLDEVPDIAWWYESRHWKKRMTTAELVRGTGQDDAPSMNGPWKVLSMKDQGVTPGFMIADSRGRRYFLKFDPTRNPEMATASDVIGSRFFHAFGYFVPDYHIVRFDRSQLAIAEGATIKIHDTAVQIRDSDIDRVLSPLHHGKDGRFRAVASAVVPGQLLGPFRYHGTRSDDPNDVFPHEHRRDLRGLYVFCAWLGHEDSRSINTLDTLIEVNGVKVIRHDLIDFGSTLGSASTKPNPARSGHEYLFAWKPSAIQFFSLGLYIPDWERYKYNYFPSIGRFEWEIFDPDNYFTDYPNPAFLNRLPDDEFWAAKQVMNFTDQEIAAIVRTGEYSDPKAEAWVIECLKKRRDKIGKVFFNKVLPLDKFAADGGRLTYVDLAEYFKVEPRREYTVSWSEFDNNKGQKIEIGGAASFTLPQRVVSAAAGTYWCADIRGDKPGQSTSVYLRKTAGGAEVVGIDRFWPPAAQKN